MDKDVEKDTASGTSASAQEHQLTDNTLSTENQTSLQRLEAILTKYNLEGRGIQRVLPNERHAPGTSKTSITQVYILWFSLNLAAQNIALGMLGPLLFKLPFGDCFRLSGIGVTLGCLPVAYIATFGPSSGLRAMVLARYSMGWWGARLIVVFNIIVALGYCLLDAVIAGQIMSAVTDGSLSVFAGIIIVTVITWVVSTFGYSIFHSYERYSWVPQLMVLCFLVGAAGPKFNFSPTPVVPMDSETLLGNKISFLSLCLSAAITYAGGASDFFVYYPEGTSKLRVFNVTVIGLSLSFTLTFILGIGLGSGVATNKSWANAYEISPGALIAEGFAPLGIVGKVCGFIVALGLVGNMIAPTYVAGVDFQVLGKWWIYIPRFVWNTLAVIAYSFCAVVGREQLAPIFTNFLALMGYFAVLWIAVMIEEHVIFKKIAKMVKFDWEDWNDQAKLPLGVAALTAFLVGWVGAILSMAQEWYVGPFAKDVGKSGADLGNFVGFAWAALVYPPLRWLELKWIGR